MGAALVIEHEITYLDGPYISIVTGWTQVEPGFVTVETDGALYVIPARLVIAWRVA